MASAEADSKKLLEVTKEEDREWVSFSEENLILNEPLVSVKFNDLDDGKQKDEGAKKEQKKQHQEESFAPKLIGLVDLDEIEFKIKAVQQWTKDLLESCNSGAAETLSFQTDLTKKIKVLRRLHRAHLREKKRSSLKKLAKKVPVKEEEGIDVPVVMRLGILTIFPLIEALGSLKEFGPSYGSLCKRVLDILLNVLATLPPLALHEEPADCLDAFTDFILSLIKKNNFVIDSEEKAQPVVALVGLALSRGNTQHLLLAIDVLFQIHKSSGQGGLPKVGEYLKQLTNHRKNTELSVIFESALKGSWSPYHQAIPEPSENSSENVALAADGSFVYLHTKAQGLVKLGTGYNGTIAGHVLH
eukprot:TRINITY_DN1953_c0_g1_i4.p1 TRINITY_DN1953_c0_g1~~TRINITY_DN1953_c0_g1_i4.p1  ORF type:complete len:358 (-),score=88.26 TRINITY_DN1953_c0_g1_i4:280-1353(-)